MEIHVSTALHDGRGRITTITRSASVSMQRDLVMYKTCKWLLIPVTLVTGYLWGRGHRRPVHGFWTRLITLRRRYRNAMTVYPTMSYVGQPLDIILTEIEHGRVSAGESAKHHDPTRIIAAPSPYVYVVARLRDGTGMALDEPTAEAVARLLHTIRRYNVTAPLNKRVMVQAID